MLMLEKKVMKHPITVFCAGFILFLAQLALWGGMVMVQVPMAHQELASTLKLEMPGKMVPVILAHYPELNAMSYESTVEYCGYHDVLDMDINVEGITDEQVCEIIDGGLVSDTEELRGYLVQKVVSTKVDDYFVESKGQAVQLQWIGAFFILIGGFLAVAAFAVLYFGTKTFPRCLFWYSVFSAVCAFGNMISSLLCFLVVPGIVIGAAQGSAGSSFEGDVLALMDGYIREVVGGLFIWPAFIFGGLTFFFSLIAALFYVMGMYFDQDGEGGQPPSEIPGTLESGKPSKEPEPGGGSTSKN